MKMRYIIKAALAAALLTVLLLAGCSKEVPTPGDKPQPPAGMGELTLGSVFIGEGTPQALSAASSATAASSAAASSATVTNPQPASRAGADKPLPEGETLRLYAFKTGETNFSDKLATRTYTIDASGEALLDAGQDPLYLPIGAVDIYLVGPVSADIGTVDAPVDVDVAGEWSISPRQGVDLIAGYAAATVAAGSSNPLPTMILTHKMARVQVVVSEHDQAAYENLKVKEMKLYAQPTTGSYNLDATGGTVTANSDGQDDFAFTQITEETASQRYSITTILLPQAEREMKIETTFECNQKNVEAGDNHPTLRYRQSGLVTSTLAAGSATQFTTAPLTPIEIKWRTKVLPWNDVMGEDITVPGPAALVNHTTRPANSYYCTTADGGVKFDASKKPRTKSGAIGADILNSYKKDVKPASIAILWQTAKDHGVSGGASNMTIRSINYDTSSGICEVITNKGAGNAYLVGKDASNNIIWGWHIWVTDGAVGSIAEINGVTFMDRNMGALAATTSQPIAADAYKYFGLLYQWGRKEPITGQGAGTVVNQYTRIFDAQGTEIIGGLGGFTLNTAGASSMADCVQNPLTFYAITAEGANKGAVMSGNNATWSDTGNKSIYDPCPYGYRVTKRYSFNEFPSFSLSGTQVQYGTVWNGSWWGLAGRRTWNSGAIEYVGSYSYQWISTQNSTTRAYNLLYSRDNYTLRDSNAEKSAGYSIRCVADTEADVPDTNPVNPPSASDYVKIGDVYWTKGNLVATSSTASGMNGCKVGAPTDGGLYFQFGSLIGYKGGAQANGGTGVGIPQAPLTTNGTYWNGAGSWSWANDAMVWPTSMSQTPTGWPYKNGSGISTLSDYYFNYSEAPYANGGQDIRGFNATIAGDSGSGTLATGRYASKGVGDPCTYYLGDKWRLPTAAEYKTLFDEVANGTAWSSVTNWSWTTSTYNGALRTGSTLFFPASGYRGSSMGSFYAVATDGYCWSSSVYDATSGYTLRFFNTSVRPQHSYNRSGSFPVRCVSSAL